MPKGYEGFDDDRGSDDGDQRLSAEDFFALLASGQTVVKARWSNSVTDPSIAVDRLELEDWLITGLNRKEVARLRNLFPIKSSDERWRNRAATVLGAWKLTGEQSRVGRPAQSGRGFRSCQHLQARPRPSALAQRAPER